MAQSGQYPSEDECPLRGTDIPSTGASAKGRFRVGCSSSIAPLRTDNSDPVLLKHMQQFRDPAVPMELLIDGGKHLKRILSSDFQHLAAALTILECVHCSARYVH